MALQPLRRRSDEPKTGSARYDSTAVLTMRQLTPSQYSPSWPGWSGTTHAAVSGTGRSGGVAGTWSKPLKRYDATGQGGPPNAAITNAWRCSARDRSSFLRTSARSGSRRNSLSQPGKAVPCSSTAPPPPGRIKYTRPPPVCRSQWASVMQSSFIRSYSPASNDSRSSTHTDQICRASSSCNTDSSDCWSFLTRAPRERPTVQSPLSDRIHGQVAGPMFQSSVKTGSTAPTHSIATSGASSGPIRRSYMPGALPSSWTSTVRPSVFCTIKRAHNSARSGLLRDIADRSQCF